MSLGYTWDGIDFKTRWNVQVQDVKGHLDFNKRKSPTEADFGIDTMGVTPFTAATDISIESRDIKLKCFLQATTEEIFHTRLAAFKSAVCATGMHSLVLRNAYNTYRVYQKDKGTFKPMRFDNDQLVGDFEFVLREPKPTPPVLSRGLAGHWTLSESDEVTSNIYTSDFSGGVDSWGATRGAAAAPIDGIGARDDNLRFTCNTDNGTHYMLSGVVQTVGKKYGLAFDYFIPTGQSNIDGLKYFKSGAFSDNQDTTGSWGSVDDSYASTQGKLQISATDGGNTTFQDAGGDDLYYLRMVILDEIHNNDQTANNNDLVLWGTEYTTDRKATADKALDFDGTADFGDTTSPYQSEFRKSFSISMWCKPDDGHPNSTETFCGVTDGGSNYVRIILLTTGYVQLWYRAASGDAKTAQTNTAVFANGAETWHHIAITVNDESNQMDVFFDGAKVALNSTFNGDISSVIMSNYVSTDNLYLGARNNNGTADNFFTGDLHDTRIYNRALSAEEVKYLFKLYNNALDY